MIDYLEIRDKSSREVIGIVDAAKSVIWKSVYYGVGEFEIYVSAELSSIDILAEDNYVTRPDNSECGIIERIEITNDRIDGKMIVASGRFIKSILDRRIVYSATLSGVGNNYIWHCTSSTLRGNVEAAVRGLIFNNAVEAGDINRNIPEIYWTDEDITGLPDVIVTDTASGGEESAEKQVTYKNLLEYTDSVLQEYSCGAKMWLDDELLRFRYKIYKGADRSRDSTTEQPIIFSQDFDNLTASNYVKEKAAYKTTALIGGEGEGTERKCAFAYAWISGLERREIFVDAKDLTQEEQTMQDYRKQLEAQGRQAVVELQQTETFDGGIDLTNSFYNYGVDYNLGDLITIEDKDIGKYINARILSVTEVQDDDGYKIDIEYGV